MTERLIKKADILVERFIKKLEEKYKTNEKREYVLKIVMKKLNNLAEKKPRAKNLV
jgi:predicted house-cleaning NTP pyrophosphatase (Maf/HAM1 superfamily)